MGKFLLVLSVFAFSSNVFAHSGNNSAALIHACVFSSYKIIRIVGDNGACLNNETPLHLSMANTQGLKGDTGAPGIRGAQGSKGDKGETGPQGPRGDTGATGSQGAKGETGAIGPKGDKGETGAQGSKGDTGATGSQGAKGETGAIGPKGDKGETGAQGSKGDTGATGSQGAKGETGAQGDKGDPGASVSVEDILSKVDQGLNMSQISLPAEPMPVANNPSLLVGMLSASLSPWFIEPGASTEIKLTVKVCSIKSSSVCLEGIDGLEAKGALKLGFLGSPSAYGCQELYIGPASKDENGNVTAGTPVVMKISIPKTETNGNKILMFQFAENESCKQDTPDSWSWDMTSHLDPELGHKSRFGMIAIHEWPRY